MVLFSLSLWILFIDLFLFPPSSSSWAKVICGIFFWFSFVGWLVQWAHIICVRKSCVVLLCIFTVPSWYLFHSLQAFTFLGVLFYSNTVDIFFSFCFLDWDFWARKYDCSVNFFVKFFTVSQIYFSDTDANTSPRTLTGVCIGVC